MYTEQQQNAINADNADILVSAAAGAGKTAVLVQRVINAITREAPVDIDRILIVTFTEAAAASMRTRIGRELTRLSRRNPRGRAIKKQLMLLGGAHISTVHAFCKKIVTEHAARLGLDPRFKIGGGAELSVIKRDCLENVLEAAYNNSGGNADFALLVETYGSKLLDTPLRELVFKIYEFLLTSPRPAERAREYASLYDGENLRDFDKTPWNALFFEAVTNALEEARFELLCCERACLADGGPLKYLDVVKSNMAQLDAFLKTPGGAVFLARLKDFEFEQNRLPPFRKGEHTDEGLRDAAQKARNNAKAAIKKAIKTYCQKTPRRYLAEMKNQKRVFDALVALCLEFKTQYDLEKQNKNLLDFNDLEQLSLAVLYETAPDGALLPTEAAKTLASRFDYVYTDEYQDSNYIQELILSAVSGKAAPNRFMVGDVKQSIYRFRQARPQIFIEKYNAYPPFDPNKPAPRVRIDLTANFRSRGNILDCVNFLFYQLMGAETGGIDYNDAHALTRGAVYPENANPNAANDDVEIYFIDANDKPQNAPSDGQTETDITKYEAEAIFIGKKILETLKAADVFDEAQNAYRRAKFSDIVILSPSVKPVSRYFAETFEALGIPLYIAGSGDFFKTYEISALISLLHVIDNPKQDLCLLAALRAPVYDFTCDELALIRAFSKHYTFYDCLVFYGKNGENAALKEKITLFLSDLDFFREYARCNSVSNLIWTILNKTFYLEIISSAREGALKKANILSLAEHAQSLAGSRDKSLFHFLRAAEKLRISSADIAEAKSISENRDTVRLMSVHASKGLEFPIVFVCGLGAGFNTADVRQAVLTDYDFGFASDYVDLTHRIRFKTMAKTALEEKIKREETAEKLRILYVAVTRAKEKLFLTAVTGNLARNSLRHQTAARFDGVKLPEFYIYKAKNYVDFLMPALARHKSGAALPYSSCRIAFSVLPCDFSLSQTAAPEKHAFKFKWAESEADAQSADTLAYIYPRALSARLPSKISISEIKRVYYAETADPSATPFYEYERKLSLPEFPGAEKTTRDGADFALKIGKAVHAVLERADFAAQNKREHVSALIETLAKKGFIEGETAQKMPADKIVGFLNSSLAARIAKSEKVMRETPFVMSLTPGEIYLSEEYKTLDDDILLHGVIDLFFEENGKTVLVDYKTDYVTKGGEADIVKKYIPQLYVYKKAVEEFARARVGPVYLYLIFNGLCIDCAAGIADFARRTL